MDTKATQRLWRSEPPHYEYTSSILSDTSGTAPISLRSLRLLASRESVDEPSQYFIKEFQLDDASGGGGVRLAAERCISRFRHPYPSLRGLQKEIIKYKRSDGLELNATLYLPPGARARAWAPPPRPTPPPTHTAPPPRKAPPPPTPS